MRSWKFILPLLAASLCFANLCFAVQPDRIPASIDSGRMVAIPGNIHGLARPQFDQGRADVALVLHSTSLVFQPSAAQQAALHQLLSDQQNSSSPSFHKWLTPAQFADRFGMSPNDIRKVSTWLQAQGLTVVRVANSRNEIFFEGTVGNIEAAFQTEIHNYLIDGEVHYANSIAPSVPAALSGVTLGVHNLYNFQPRPHAVVRKISGANPEFTSVQTGNHFVAPGDFATIYDVGPLYTAGSTGTGQAIILTGQSSISLTDVANFRSAGGLPANVPTLMLVPGTGTSARCTGDEGESDLDVEWSGAVAKDASITLLYAGLATGDTCTNRQFGAFDALQYAIDNNLAPVISNSYGNCESAIGSSNVLIFQGWIQQGNAQGQTVMSASGDSGAADCDYHVSSGTQGLAVDIPAAIPEVTAMGGSEFNGDLAGTLTGGNANATQYWSGTTGGADAISTALSYIPEMGWNDTNAAANTDHELSSSGGGASIYFAKPSWQTGTGVPNDAKRDVPDLALNASDYHDPYLFCSEDDGTPGGVGVSCTNGFRDAPTNGSLTAVGGTSAAAPTFAGIVALINGYTGESGLGNINPTLYSLAATSPSAFHDITTGTNIVPCTTGTTGCPATSPFQYGFSAGTGYDQVTGLGSVDADALAVAYASTLVLPDFTLVTATAASPASVPAGQSATATLTIAPVNSSTQTINFSSGACTGVTGVTCTVTPNSVTLDGTNPQTVTVTVITAANMTVPSGVQTITVTGTGSGSAGKSHTAPVTLTITATNESFTLTTPSATVPATPGGTAQVVVTVMGAGSPIAFSPAASGQALSYSCSGLPSESMCTFSPNNGSAVVQSSVTVNINTTAPTTQSLPLPGHGKTIFYALLFPGMFGIVFAAGSRGRGARLLSLIVLLGFSTLWMGACGGTGSSSSQNNPGTPAGSYSVVITGSTLGPTVITATSKITLQVN